MEKIICVVGPTASGKSDLAVRLAKRYDGEILSCDSMQIYRGMDVGTAKPTAADRDGVVHHMLDVAEPEEEFSAGKYAAMADPLLRDILARGKTAVIAGGTGLYLDALILGRTFAPYPADGLRQRLEEELERMGGEAMLRRLAEVDPATAARLHPADHKRIVRALEIYEQTGMTMAERDALGRAQPPKYRPVKLGLWFSDRQELYRRIDRRVDRMMEQGLTEEVRSLLARGVPASATAMQAIGYKEIARYLRGETTLEEAAAAVKQGTRRYAKRQMTWFRRDPEIQWIDRTADPDLTGIPSMPWES